MTTDVEVRTEWAVEWIDERGLEVMKLWDFTDITTAEADQHARQIVAENPRVKAVFRRAITVGPWIEVAS